MKSNEDKQYGDDEKHDKKISVISPIIHKGKNKKIIWK